jgi:hypothetical protein
VIATLLGAEWRNTSAETREKYNELAPERMQRHRKDHPDYVYNKPRKSGNNVPRKSGNNEPRKTVNNKRRVTSKKAAALTQMAHNLSSQPSAVVSNTVEDNISTSTSLADTTVTMDTGPKPFPLSGQA